MRMRLPGLVGLALACGSAAPILHAQDAGPSRRWGVGAGVGPTFPTGALGSSDNPGVNGLMYFSYSLAPRLAVGLDVGATWLPHVGTGHTDLYELLVTGVWRVGAWRASPRPFLFGAIGSVAIDADDPVRDGRLALSGGIGTSLGRGDARLFVLARYLRVQAAGGARSMIPVTVGFATRAP